MIQRIQSVYLLLVAILLVVAICLPVGHYYRSGWDSGSCIQAVGRDLADGNFQSTWGLFGILLLSAIIGLCTIFLFRKPYVAGSYDGVRQSFADRFCVFAFFAFMFILKNDLNAMAFPVGMGFMPACRMYHIELSGFPRYLS